MGTERIRRMKAARRGPRVVRTGGRALSVLLAVVGVGFVMAPAGATAQSRAVPTLEPVENSLQPADVPFGPGERFTYKVKWGIFSLGGGELSVRGVEDVRGVPSYHIYMQMKGGRLGLSVDDEYSSWMGVEDLATRRYIQDVDEVNYERLREYEIFPEERRWEQRNIEPELDDIANAEIDDSGTTMEAAPQDELSFLYWARTLPLVVGETYTYNNYFKDKGNPVVLEVLRTETVEVPAGVFETVVVRPIVQTKGLFSEGGEAEVYLSNDDRRLLVRLETKLSIGNLSLHLESAEFGRRLAGIKSTTALGN